jgi:hypothetical protein
MKTKLLSMFAFLIVTSTQVLVAQPSNRGLPQKLDTLVNALVVCPPQTGPRFVDNGDGTICDHQTGLMWEMKDAEDGVQDLANPHDVDNRYTWTSGADGDFTNPDGTAFTDFLPRLNGEIAGSVPSEQLGGHSDWRLPTSAELQTILDLSFCSPCIDPVFGPTAAPDFSMVTPTSYVSSTSSATDPNNVWFVYFFNGLVDNGIKSSNFTNVRAVRGGR